MVLTIIGLIFGFVLPTLFISDPLAQASADAAYRAQIMGEYQLAGIIIAVIAFITLFISLKWGCKEREEFKEDPQKTPSFIDALKYTLKNKSFLTYVVAGLMCWISLPMTRISLCTGGSMFFPEDALGITWISIGAARAI